MLVHNCLCLGAKGKVSNKDIAPIFQKKLGKGQVNSYIVFLDTLPGDNCGVHTS